MVIEHLTLPGGRELINVPASWQVLEELGLPKDHIEDLMLEQTKESARREVQNLAGTARAKLTGRADRYKLLGWSEKSVRAHRVVDGKGTDRDIAILKVEAEARDRGEKPEQLAQKQVDKATKLAMAAVVIDGMESAALKTITGKRVFHTVHEAVAKFRTELEDKSDELSKGEE